MRWLVFLSLLVVLAGCAKAQRIDRLTLDQRYQQTQLAEGVLSVVPLRQDSSVPPTVVNWWYAGTSSAEHELVYRSLTWDAQGNPVGRQTRYRVAASQLTIANSFARTSNARRWLPLHEVAQEIEPPADLSTARKAPNPVDSDPIRRPNTPIQSPNN
ncbi:MAG: hypothetical protein AAF085_01480 [Planctomycetota bacterium]